MRVCYGKENKMRSGYVQDFTKGNITKQLISFATPLFLSSLLQVVYNMVDMIIVGHRLGEIGLSAVSVGGDVTNFMTLIAMGFANAGQVIISQYIGAGHKERIGRFISTMFSFLTVVSIAIAVVALILREPILIKMKTPDAAYAEALAYSTVCMLGLFFIYGYNMVSAVLRGLGDSKHPFVFISIAAVLNMILDLVFVLALDMGAGGAALATVISQGVSFVACAVFLVKKREEFGFEVKPADLVRIDLKMLSALLKLGTPMAIKSASISFSKIFVNSFLNGFGTTVSAFAGVANKLASIANLVSNSLNSAGSTMVGQNIGAGEYKRVPRIFLRVFAISAGISVLLSVILCVFPEAVFSIFTSGEDKQRVLEIAMAYIPIGVLMFFGSAFRSPANALLNGSGNYKINFATAIFDGIILRIGLSYLFGVVLDGGYLGFFLGDALAGFTPFWIGIVFYLSGRWKTRIK